MFKWIHRAGIHIDVWVELLHRDPKTSGFEEAAEGGAGNSFAEATRDPTGNKDVFSHG